MSTLEQRRDTLVAIAKEYADELMDMVANFGGDPDYLESWGEKMGEDLHSAFLDAIKARDDRRTSESRAAYRADLQRDLHNA